MTGFSDASGASGDVKLTTIICTQSERRWLQLCAAVQSLETQTLHPHELVVVVDHNARLRQRAASAFRDAIVIDNGGESGLAGARNSGTEIASGTLVAFLDDDAVATSDWLERLAAPFEDPSVIGVGGAVIPSWPVRRPVWFPEEFDWVVGCTHSGMPRSRMPVRNFVGANMAFRRAVFDEVQFYSGIGHANGKPLGGSDPDFCIRVKRRWPDKQLVYHPDAVVFHDVAVERTSLAYFLRRCYNEGTTKALLTRRVGTGVGLVSEREYVVRTLPQAAARSLLATTRDPRALARVGTIVGGLLFTAYGYVAGSRRAAGAERER
jgi:GT2 family glycosyltransferase